MARESLKKNNKIFLLTKYIKSLRWGVAICLSYIKDARCIKVNLAGKEMRKLNPVNTAL